MKKFYCNGKIVYLNNEHDERSAAILLRDLSLAKPFDKFCEALLKDQDMLGVAGPSVHEVVVLDISEDSVEEPNNYVLPNGKSAPFGLTGEELAAIPENIKVYSISLSLPGNISEAPKVRRQPNQMLVEVDRDLIFATREKAVEAYNALFGDLYGEI